MGEHADEIREIIQEIRDLEDQLQDANNRLDILLDGEEE